MLIVLLTNLLNNIHDNSSKINPFEAKIAKVGTLSLTKTAQNPYVLGPNIPI